MNVPLQDALEKECYEARKYRPYIRGILVHPNWWAKFETECMALPPEAQPQVITHPRLMYKGTLVFRSYDVTPEEEITVV